VWTPSFLCLALPATQPHRTVDVAVIGSGFAGLAAAIEASKESHSVLIFEKMATPGGNSIYSAGQIAAVASTAQLGSGITDDSVPLMMQDMMAAGDDLNHPNLLRTMIEESAATVEWTQQELGVKYRDRVSQLGGHSVPRTLSTENASGRDIIDPMLKKIYQSQRISLELNTKLSSLIVHANNQNFKNSGVCGVVVEKEDGSKERIDCRKGVILAAGGFGADVAFRQVQNPSFHQDVMTTNQPGSTAEVLREALRVGAQTVQLSHIQLGPWTS
jgi:succinate dehydrogenase/fumarate reductase flavoprotein subunit